MNLSLLAVLLFLCAGASLLLVPSYAQSTDIVVINEVETNPFVNDAKSVSEWIEIYNPTDSDIDLFDWKIASTTGSKKTLTIPPFTIIEPDSFLIFTYKNSWFSNFAETIEIRNPEGLVVDKTPRISDNKNDATTWQRVYDGHDTDDISDWKFASSTLSTSNGKLIIESEIKEHVVSISTDKSSYIFGDLAIIQGDISKHIIIENKLTTESVVITISGPDFSRSITLHPRSDLTFKTQLNLHEILGINEGNYTITATHGGATSSTVFSVGGLQIESEILSQSNKLELFTDKPQYIPRETVTLSGNVSETVPFEGMIFHVHDSFGVLVSTGNLYPVDGKFSTTFFIAPTDTRFGTYSFVATYSDLSASTTFEVAEDFKEDTILSLWVDKDVYGLGEIVNVTGRLNSQWTYSFDLEILQTKQLFDRESGTSSIFKIIDSVLPDGDGKFAYSFNLPVSDSGLGDYEIKVSTNIGTAAKFIKVVDDPQTYVPEAEPLTISTPKSVYDFNLDRNVVITGSIRDIMSRTSFDSIDFVTITIFTDEGDSLKFVGTPGSSTKLGPDNKPIPADTVTQKYEYTVLPDPAGSFFLTLDLNRILFTEGTYLIKAQYNKQSAFTTFDIIDYLVVGDTEIRASLDKSVYGFNQTVYLNGTFGTPTRDMKIALFTPSGDTYNFAVPIDSGFFSWDWATPKGDNVLSVTNERSTVSFTTVGIYRMLLETANTQKELFFKVSETPESDELVIPNLSVSTSKSLYKAGETLDVEGYVKNLAKGNDLQSSPQRILIKILSGESPYGQFAESAIYPNSEGKFQTTFDLPISVFAEGKYQIRATYFDERIVHTFSVANDFDLGSYGPITLLVSTDKSEYSLGEIVTISGKPSQFVYLDSFDVQISRVGNLTSGCDVDFCSLYKEQFTIVPNSLGAFTHQFSIPNSVDFYGSYIILVDAGFEPHTIKFNVTANTTTTSEESPEDSSDEALIFNSPPIIETKSKITEKTVSIQTVSKVINRTLASPQILTGFLITMQGDESDVNLEVTSESGICIIGSNVDCLVTESTRKPDQIYKVVDINGTNFNVQYTGADARLEKFNIFPESPSAFLPDTTWKVDIIKDEQASRFYYKLTYKNVLDTIIANADKQK